MKGQPSHACSAEKHRLEKVLGQRGYGGRGGVGSRGPLSVRGNHVKEEEKLEDSRAHWGFKPHISLIEVVLLTLLPHQIKTKKCCESLCTQDYRKRAWCRTCHGVRAHR